MPVLVDDVIDSLANELGENPGDVDVRKVFEGWIDGVVREIWHAGDWFFKWTTQSLTTSVGTAVYSLDVNSGEIRRITVDGQSDELTYVTIDDVASRDIDPANSGTPWGWMFAGYDEAQDFVNIRLVPVPVSAKSYTLWQYRADSGVLTGTSTVPLPPAFQSVLKDGVRRNYELNIGSQLGLYYDTKFKEGLVPLYVGYTRMTAGRSSKSMYTDIPTRSGLAAPPQLPSNFPR